jgi:hypothetical protein
MSTPEPMPTPDLVRRQIAEMEASVDHLRKQAANLFNRTRDLTYWALAAGVAVWLALMPPRFWFMRLVAFSIVFGWGWILSGRRTLRVFSPLLIQAGQRLVQDGQRILAALEKN